MRLMTIDIGIVNPAYCIIDYTELDNTIKIKLVELKKDNWENKTYQKIVNLIEYFNPDKIFVERQGGKSRYSKIGTFIHGFCVGRNIEFSFCHPISHKQNLKLYKDRKNYSIDKFKEYIKEYKLKVDLDSYQHKLDDISDAFNMAIREIENLL